MKPVHFIQKIGSASKSFLLLIISPFWQIPLQRTKIVLFDLFRWHLFDLPWRQWQYSLSVGYLCPSLLSTNYSIQKHHTQTSNLQHLRWPYLTLWSIPSCILHTFSAPFKNYLVAGRGAEAAQTLICYQHQEIRWKRKQKHRDFRMKQKWQTKI